MSRRTSRAPASLALVALALLSVLGSAGGVRAGDRPLEVLLVNMAPEGLRQDCMRVIQRVLRHEDANLHRVGGERVRELAGHRGDASHFTSWRAEELDAVVRVVRAESIDAVVLIDCRAEEGLADAWVRAPSGGVARLRLRHTVIDDARAEWLARGILMHGLTGFNP